jgi:hypothetical protein
MACEYSGTATLTNYNATDGTGNPANQAAYLAPTVTTQAVSSIGSITATGNGNLTVLGVPNPTQYGHVWSTAGIPTVNDFKTELGTASSTGAYTSSLTSLTASTKYYIRAYAVNTVETIYGVLDSFTTFAPAPSAQPTNLRLSTRTAVGNDTIALAFTASASAERYLVLRRTGSAPTFVPSSGTAYTAGSTQGDAFVVYAGTDTSAKDGNLAGATYYYSIYAYRSDGASASYLTNSPLSGSIVLSSDGAATLGNDPGTPVSAGFPDAGVDITFPNGSNGSDLTVTKTSGQPGASFGVYPNVRGLQNLYFTITSSNSSPGNYTLVMDFSSLNLTPVSRWNNFTVLKRSGSPASWQDITTLGGSIVSRATDGIYGKFTIAGLSSFSEFAIGEINTTHTVTSASESGVGSLKSIIAQADTGDVIVFNTVAMGSTTITLTSPIVIGKNLTIIGPPGGIVLNGNGVCRVLTIESTVIDRVRISNMVIKGGDDTENIAGGIVNNGKLHLVNCQVTNNRDLGSAGGYGALGGIYSNGDLILVNSTVANNTGAPDNSGIGGIYCEGPGTLSLYNSIVYGNRGQENNFSASQLVSNFRNSLLEDNVGTLMNTTGSLTSSNPQFVDTAQGIYHLTSGSPCLNAGSNNFVTDTTDLYGAVRTQGGTVDMGAYEGAKALPTVSTSAATSVTTSSATLGGTISSDGGTSVSERGVVYSLTAGTPTIGIVGVTKDINGSGTGAFSKPITGMVAGSKYYFRVYAINLIGTAYGAVDSFVCVKQSQTITFIDTVKVYGDTNFAPATSSSGLTVAYMSSDTSIASIVSNQIQIRKSGFCTITATQSGNDSYLPADTVRRVLIVNKAVPTITTWPTASSISYGQTLANSTLSGQVVVTAGTFAFTNPSTAPATGTANQSVTFTPTDTANYTTAVQNVSVTVGKTAPTITAWPAASSISYGQTLASSTLSGQVVVTAGTFAFTNPSTAPAAGTANQSVTFTPTDTVNYTTAVQNVSVTVGKTAPTITTWPTASSISFGQTLANSTLSGQVVVTAGAFAFTNSSTAPAAGTANQSVTFTPTDTANYTTAVQNVSVTVGKTAPTITTWPVASSISYGQTLANSTLSGQVAVTAGIFVFTNTSTAPTAGTVSQSVTFIPIDTANYTAAVQNVSVIVGKAVPTITTWPTASSITYGQTLISSTLSGDVVVTPGIFSFTSPSTVAAAGVANQSVTFTPTDTINHSSITQDISVTVNAKAITITGLTGVNKTYDRTTVATLSGTAALSGVEAGDIANVVLGGTPVALFADALVSTGKAITITGYTITGSSASNYTLSQPVGLTASITAKELQVTGFSAISKYYDGTSGVSLLGGTLNGIVDGDTVIISSVSASFGDSLIGKDKTVTVESITLGGNQASNYTVILPTGLTGSILVPPPSAAPVVKTVFSDTMGTSIPLAWDSVASATRYRIVVSNDSTFVSALTDTTVEHTLKHFAGNLTPGAVLWLRMCAVNSSGSGPWTMARRFSVMRPPANVEEYVRTVIQEPVVDVLPSLTISKDSNNVALDSVVLVVAMTKDTIAQSSTVISQVSQLYDFTGSSVQKLTDSITLTFAIPDTFIDGTPITPAELVDVRVYEVDTIGTMTAIYNAVIDTIAKTISYETDHLGINALAIDKVPPSIVDNTERTPKVGGTAPAIAGQIVDNVANCKGYAYFRKGGSHVYDSLPVTIAADGSFSIAVANTTLDLNGFEYFLTAYDGTNRVTVDRKDIPVKVNAVADTSTMPTMQWRLFSTPLNLSSTDIASFFARVGQYGKDWKLFRRPLASSIDTIIEYGQNLSALESGYSYWIKSYKNPIQLSADSGVTTPISRCYEAVIPAKTWAAIGNPYMFSVGWKSITDSTGVNASKLIGPYTYEGSAWIPPSQIDKIEPWRGYYIYNSSDSAITMRIPSLAYRSKDGVAKQVFTDSTTTSMELVVSSKYGRDYRNYFGFTRNATAEYDLSVDFPKAGSPEIDAPTMWFSRPGFAKVASRFQTDFTSLKNGGASWQAFVGNLKQSSYYLFDIEGVASLPDSLKCIAADKHGGIIHDMRTGAYSFEALENEKQREVEIVIGTKEYVDRHIKNMRLPPSKLTMNTRFTRRGLIDIKFAIPWSEQLVPVRLDLFDMRGRLIKTIVNELRNEGYYTMQWNLRAEQKASGLHIIRLTAGKKRMFASVVVVK